MSKTQIISELPSADTNHRPVQTCGMKHLFKTKENHIKVRNLNKVFYYMLLARKTPITKETSHKF